MAIANSAYTKIKRVTSIATSAAMMYIAAFIAMRMVHSTKGQAK